MSPQMNLPPSDGRNPMRYDCEVRGCFNVKHRPKIEVFAPCLPGRIAFSDLDAITEVNSHFLLQEWKSYEGEVPTGQRIMFQRMTAISGGRFTVFVVVGDAETMAVKSVATFFSGRIRGFEPVDLDGLKQRVSRWAAWAGGAESAVAPRPTPTEVTRESEIVLDEAEVLALVRGFDFGKEAS